MAPRELVVNTSLLTLQQQMFNEAAERYAQLAQRNKRRNSLRSAKSVVDGDEGDAEQSPNKSIESPSKRRRSSHSTRHVAFTTEVVEGQQATRRRSSVRRDSAEISPRRASLRSSMSPKSPKHIPSNTNSSEAAPVQISAPPLSPKLRNPYPLKRRNSLRSHTHYPNHYQHSVPTLPPPKLFLHRCGRANCSARFRSRNKLHAHIRTVHGHVPLEWMRSGKGPGKDGFAEMAARWNCHICGRACADSRRLSSHVEKAHAARESVDNGKSSEGGKKSSEAEEEEVIVIED
ncbi:hypothetical protein GLAREA_03082 [Glarea lozoyensis ATCC 20868]|uniref:C2H2-type domain-containing protein n=1 Tax=Glarea lozoyensis (strain ATCC 20868 / MF5171) TaxID=1116229 RepID=S3DKS7_GLAL2|nr:uncharacterized protein GLAREA_03082 [Glarea lozoyensis ATCC 20868]EPE27168.1 hypothetical protein GLAREA_03082 [Glarea lozoyensis ATCC 20868]